MSKWVVIALALIVGVFLVSAAYAHPRGSKYGRCISQAAKPDADAVKKFRKETLPLRGELMTKKIEVRNEYAREKPDRDRIASLKKEIIDIRTEIMKKADEAGMPAMKNGRSACGRMAGRGIMNKCVAGW